MGVSSERFVEAMKLLMIFALLIVASAAAKKSDDPCVPCEILNIAIKVCPNCEILHDIWEQFCEGIIEDEPCVPCQQLKKAISLCPDCWILKKIYKGNCEEITITPEPTYDPTDKMKFAPPPSWMDPCVPCKAIYKAIWYCPDCEVLYEIYLKYCQTSPVTVSSSAVKG